MSFIMGNSNILAKSLWPKDVPQLQKDKSQSALSKKEIVPRTREALFEWCRVVRITDAPDPTRAHILCHVNPSNPGAKEEVLLRLQGYVAKVDLRQGGNWDSSVNGCSRALQTIYLDSGGCEGPYVAQLQALHNIRSFIQESLRCEPTEFKHWPTLKLQHRVFTRVRANAPTPKSLVGEYADPGGFFKKVAKQWVVADVVSTGKQDAQSGRVQACYAKEIRVGDFVNVTVRIEIASYSRDAGRVAQVYWNVVRIVKLKSVTDPSDEANTATSSQVTTNLGYDFD